MAFRATSISMIRATVRAQQPNIKPQFQPHVGHFTQSAVFKWVPTLALWGGVGAGAVSLFMSGVPIFQNDVLKKLPIPGLAAYFEDKVPDSDKPF